MCEHDNWLVVLNGTICLSCGEIKDYKIITQALLDEKLNKTKIEEGKA